MVGYLLGRVESTLSGLLYIVHSTDSCRLGDTRIQTSGLSFLKSTCSSLRRSRFRLTPLVLKDIVYMNVNCLPQICTIPFRTGIDEICKRGGPRVMLGFSTPQQNSSGNGFSGGSRIVSDFRDPGQHYPLLAWASDSE